MRIFGVLSLLVVVAIVGLLARKQLGAAAPPPAPVSATTQATPVLSGSPQQQTLQFQQAVEGAVQQPRPMPDDSK